MRDSDRDDYLRGIVGRTFPEMQRGDLVGLVAKPQVQVGRLQAVLRQVGFRVVGDANRYGNDGRSRAQ